MIAEASKIGGPRSNCLAFSAAPPDHRDKLFDGLTWLSLAAGNILKDTTFLCVERARQPVRRAKRERACLRPTLATRPPALSKG